MICKYCSSEMDLVDKDPELGEMYACTKCRAVYIEAGPGNAFDKTGWRGEDSYY